MRGILSYYVKNPDAKDTPEGIHKFWLAHRPMGADADDVRKVLEFLAREKKWLTERSAGSSGKIYGLNKNRLKEIESFLHEEGNGN